MLGLPLSDLSGWLIASPNFPAMAGSPSDVEMEGQSDRITKEDLMGRLDGLLEQYLNLVDQYQNAVQNLSTLLSNVIVEP